MSSQSNVDKDTTDETKTSSTKAEAVSKETPKSLLGESLYKYRPPRVDEKMYQCKVPPMLSLSERKIEHRRVTSSVTKDFTNPILVWPGESDESIKEEEEEEEDDDDENSRRVSSENIRNFLSKARRLFERSSSRALTSTCSDESQLLEFFNNHNCDEQQALFKLEAKLGLGVLESLETRRIEDPTRIISAKSKVTKKNVPATNSWMATSKRCVVRGATQAQLLKVYEDGRTIVSSSPMSTGSSTKAEVMERFKMIEERLTDSRILRARAADYATTHAHLPRARLQEMRTVLQSASAKKIKMPCEVKAVRSQQSESMAWDRDAADLLEKMADKSSSSNFVCTSLELDDMIERGRALRVELHRLTHLEHKAELLRSYTDCIQRATRSDVSNATRARWVKWGVSSDEIVPTKHLKLPILKCIVSQAKSLRIDSEGLRQGIRAIQDAEAWLSRYEKARNNTDTTPTLDTLRRLASDAASLVVDMSEELKPLNEDIERAVGWISNIRNSQTVTEHNRRHVRSGKGGEEKEKLKLNVLIDLVRKSEDIGFASKETSKMRKLLNLINEWTSDVRDALRRCKEEYEGVDSSSSKMDVDGEDEDEEEEDLDDTLQDLERTFNTSIPVVDIPEREMLLSEISVRKWRDDVKKMMTNGDLKSPSLQDLEMLLNQGNKISKEDSWPYQDSSHVGLDITMKHLLEVLDLARDWNDRALHALGKTRNSGTITTDAIRNLVQESSSIAVDFSESVNELNELASQFDQWQASAKVLAKKIGNTSKNKKLTFDEVNESMLVARKLQIESEERNKIESAVNAAESWDDLASSVLAGKHDDGDNTSVVDVINTLLQSVNELVIEPPNMDMIEKLKNSLVLGKEWRTSVSRALSDTTSRLESFSKTAIFTTSNETESSISLLVSSPSLEVYSITFTAEELSKYTIAHLITLIDRVTCKITQDEETKQQQQQQQKPSCLILHGLFALGVNPTLALNRTLSEVDFSDGTMLICVTQNLLSPTLQSDTFHDLASSVLSRAASFTNEVTISSTKLVPFSNPMRASVIAKELLEKLEPLLKQNEAMICASETSEYENLVDIVKELRWAVNAAMKLKSSRAFDLIGLKDAVKKGETMTNESMRCALPELRARMDYAILCMRIMKDALKELEMKREELKKPNSKKKVNSRRSRRRYNNNDGDDFVNSIDSDYKTMLPSPNTRDQDGTFSVSNMEMLKILMLANVLHVKMPDSTLILEEMRNVRRWQQRAYSYVLGESNTAKNAATTSNQEKRKKVSEEKVEEMIESSKGLLVAVPEIRKLSNVLNRSRDWVKRFRAAQSTQGSNEKSIQALVREGQNLAIDHSAIIEPILETIIPYCLCRGPSQGFMLGCEDCEEWFHGACINLNEKDAEKIGTFVCAKCIAYKDMDSVLQEATSFLTSRGVSIKIEKATEIPKDEESTSTSVWSANYYWKVIHSAHRRMSKPVVVTKSLEDNDLTSTTQSSTTTTPMTTTTDQNDDPTTQQQQNNLIKDSSRDEVHRTIRWFDRAALIVPHLIVAHESRKKSSEAAPAKLREEVTKMIQMLENADVFSKLTVHAVTRTPLYRALVMHLWIENARKSIACVSDTPPKLSDLEALLFSAGSRGVPSAKKVLKPIQDIVRRTNNWMSQVLNTLHTNSLKVASIRKLRGFEKKLESLPVRGKKLQDVVKMLRDAIHTGGLCVCASCVTKRASKAVASSMIRPSHLVSEKQIADMKRGQLGSVLGTVCAQNGSSLDLDTMNMTPQQLLYLAQSFGMPRSRPVPQAAQMMMMMNGNNKRSNETAATNLPVAKKARLNTAQPPQIPPHPLMPMGMPAQFGLPPNLLLQNNPFLSAGLYNAMMKQQPGVSPIPPRNMLNQQPQQKMMNQQQQPTPSNVAQQQQQQQQ